MDSSVWVVLRYQEGTGKRPTETQENIMAKNLDENSTTEEIALEAVRMEKLKSLIELANMPRFNGYSDSIKAQIVEITGITVNRR